MRVSRAAPRADAVTLAIIGAIDAGVAMMPMIAMPIDAGEAMIAVISMPVDVGECNSPLHDDSDAGNAGNAVHRLR